MEPDLFIGIAGVGFTVFLHLHFGQFPFNRQCVPANQLHSRPDSLPVGIRQAVDAEDDDFCVVITDKLKSIGSDVLIC